jgi:hypothetical protein
MFIPEIQGIILHNKFFTLSTSVFSDIYAQVYYIRFFIVTIYSTLFHQHRTIFLPISLQYFFYPVSPHHRTLFRHFFVSISSYCLHLHLRLDLTEDFLLVPIYSIFSDRIVPVIYRFSHFLSFLVLYFPVAIVNLLNHSVLSPLRLHVLSRSRSGVQVRRPPLTFKQREQ